jgi:uncharacterized protein (TIGR00369 family)
LAKADNESLVRAALEAAGFLQHLGVQVGTIEKGTCTISVPFSAELSQHNGVFHGGVYAALVDISTAGAAATVVPAGHTILTAEYKLNILRAVTGAALSCEARVLKPGRLLSVVEATIYASSGKGLELAAIGLATIANVPITP